MGQSHSAALLQAASADDVEGVGTAVEQGADIHFKEQESQWSALHYAAWGGQERATRELLVRGADPNARDAEGKTPLHFAVLGGHESTVGALCDHGANVSAADTDGQTPLHKAAAQDQLALTQELVARGADLTAKLQDGSTPAHLAAWKGHGAVLSYLLQSGASSEARTADGETPLHEAAKAGQEECCRILLRQGADTAALDAESRTPADLALVNDFVRAARLVEPDPRAMQAQHRPQQQAASSAPRAESTAIPSAPVWTDGPITYPEVEFPRVNPATPANTLTRQEERQHQAQKSDWEPPSEIQDEWEGVPRPVMIPSQGTQLMEQAGQTSSAEMGDGDPFWMVPQPIRWAASSLGGFLAARNPFRNPDSPPEAANANSSEAQLARLEEREARVSALAAPRNREQLTADQLARLRQQENEIAELRRQIQAAQGAAGSSAPASIRPAPLDAAPEPRPESSRRADRHRVVESPVLPCCKEISAEELQTITAGFKSQVSSDEQGTIYKGRLQAADVLVWVPKGSLLAWDDLQSSADLLSELAPKRVAKIKAVCQTGAVLMDLNKGSLEDALRGRAPESGSQPVKLDWQDRLRIAQHLAEGLLELHSAPPRLLHGGLRPASVLLTEAGEAQLAPPSLASVAFGAQAESAMSFVAPEIRRGEAPLQQSDVFSLGVISLQMLTGSEATGLQQYVQSAVSQGRLADILDPSASTSPESARALAELALRCTEFHPEARPDIRRVVLPELLRIAEKTKSAQRQPVLEEEPPAHLVCPITQEVMKNPVILADGYTYEEGAIKDWLKRGKTVSPMTNAKLAHLNLTPNFVIKSAASTWREQHPEYDADEAELGNSDADALAERVANLNLQIEERNRAAQLIPRASNPEAQLTGGTQASSVEDLDAALPSIPRGEASAQALRAHLQAAAVSRAARGPAAVDSPAASRSSVTEAREALAS